MGDGLKLTKEYYISYIEADKSKGVIRKEIDSQVLADLVISLTNNIVLDEFSSGDINYNSLLNKIDKTISIFKKGIE